MRAALKKLFGMEEAPEYRMSMIPTLQYLQSTPIQRHTPDIAYLNQREHQMVFICDGMQEHLPDFEKIEAYVEPKWPAFTSTPFSMWHRREDDCVIPLPYMKEFHRHTHPIRGQIMRMKTPRLIKLDEDKWNGVQFNRVKVDVTIPYSVNVETNDREGTKYLFDKAPLIKHGYKPSAHHRHPEATIDRNSKVSVTQYFTSKAWMYIGVPSFWKDQLDGGFAFKLVQRFKPNNKSLNPYYMFTIQEYDRT